MCDAPYERFLVTEEEQGCRIDQLLAKRYVDVRSRTYFQKLIEQKAVLLNDVPVKKRILPKARDEIAVHFLLQEESNLKPEFIPLDILFEDDDILVVNKPKDLVVHPGAGRWTGTFANGLIYHCKELAKLSKTTCRPGIVHRLDKDTTGVMIAAKTESAQVKLIEAFSGRRVYKEYVAICLGDFSSQVISTRIGRDPVHRQKMAVLASLGKEAVTECEKLSSNQNFSLVKLILHTGRTHQIRVHLAYKGHPILGDPVYGNVSINKRHSVDRQLLHAKVLRLHHPRTGELLTFEAPLPDDMRAFCTKFSL